MTPALQVLRGFLLVALLVACLMSPGADVALAVTEEQRIDASQARVDEVRAEIEAARDQQADDLAALAKAEEHLRAVLGAVDEAEQAVDRQEAAVTEARDELAALERRVQQQRAVVSDHAVTMYKQSTGGEGPGAELDSVLSAATTQEALDRSAYVDVVSRSDRRVLEQVGASVR